MQSPQRTFTSGIEEQLLLGIPYDTEVSIRLVRDGQTSEPIMATTGHLPSRLPKPEYVSGEPDLWWSDGRYLFTSINEDEQNWSGDPFGKSFSTVRVGWFGPC